ncbi:pyruvate dehydrogenase [Suillus paluster]|uniref:pyruvate dehydrogenase n=1 Tax=Suillus paluster TaxID=48578 RepID=UPI001B8787AD|nr:pyruvate dehydrogenase [Suillus paluster]KAG1724762.1 pyruvate dehydrogenase [Suillus paluster]
MLAGRLRSTLPTLTTASTTVEPLPAGTRSLPVAASKLLRITRESVLRTPGLIWQDEEPDRNIVGGCETCKMNLYQAVRDALRQPSFLLRGTHADHISIALAKDDTIVVFGEDIAFGGVFKCTMGLGEESGRERVFNTTLTEQGIAGFGIVLASIGHTTIAEIQFADYIFPAFDQLVNEAVKFRYHSGYGGFAIGRLTVRTPTMAVGHVTRRVQKGTLWAEIVIPCSPIQCKGFLLSAIRDRDLVVFMDPEILYRSAVEQVPIDDYTLPLSRAETLIPRSDMTPLTWGTPVYHCEAALHLLKSPSPTLAPLVPASLRNAKVELIDLQTILPWDVETVVQSVRRTKRLVIVHEAGMTGGVGGEIAAEIGKRALLRLEAPVRRFTGWE